MPKPTDYDKTHLRNLAAIGTRIDRLFKKAAEEAARIGMTIKTPLPDDVIFSFDDYPETKKHIERLMQALKDSMETIIVNGVESAWTLSNNKNNALASRVFGDNANKLTKEQARRYFSTNGAALDAFLKRKENGLNLSDKMWRYTGMFRREIELGLDLGIRSGESAVSMAKSLRQYLQHPDKLFRRVRDEHGALRLSKAAEDFHPGRGVYRSSYKNARRLAATETNIAYRTSDHLRWQQMDFVVGIEIKLSNNHTLNGVPFTDICDTLKGRYPKDFKFTGWHPHCRCHVVTVLKTEEEMAEDTQRILAGEKPLPGSENEVRSLPSNFTDWIRDNADRIERAESGKGSLPYFIRDNRTAVERILNGESKKGWQDEYRGNLIARTLDNLQTTLLSREFHNVENYDELARKGTELLSQYAGEEVSVKIDSTSMPLDIAKAHLTGLVSVLKEYRLRQGNLAEVILGYLPDNPNEHGCTSYNPNTGKKTLKLTANIDYRNSKDAINNSRCDKNRLPFSLATHEAGHLLFSFNAFFNSELIFMKHSIQSIWDEYQKEFNMLISKGDMEKAAKIMIGKYGHSQTSEFMAECFQEYRNSSKPSKYARKIGELFNQYLKS